MPWEMLEYIYSFCDTPTLLVLSLVSFGSWDMAGPLLYEHVEITFLGSLVPLFFLDIAPASSRLASSPSLLARIKTLTVDITDADDYDDTEPKLRDPYGEWDCEHGGNNTRYDHWLSHLLVPHRLLRHAPDETETIVLPVLVLPIMDSLNDCGYFEFLCTQLFPHLNPRTVVHAASGRLARKWTWDTAWFDTTFLQKWTRLERVVFKLPGSIGHSRDDQPLYANWSPPPAAIGPRTLELVLDIPSWSESYEDAFKLVSAELDPDEETLELFLDRSGVQERLADQVALTVKLVIDAQDEAVVRRDVEALEDWMKKLVVIETV